MSVISRFRTEGFFTDFSVDVVVIVSLLSFYLSGKRIAYRIQKNYLKLEDPSVSIEIVFLARSFIIILLFSILHVNV